MVRAPVEEPQGLVLRAEAITREEEHRLLERFSEVCWEPIVIRGQAARRTARHFGLSYDYESRTPRPGEAIPKWIEPPRRAAAELAGVRPKTLVEVQRYPAGSTIGWHRDAPAFGTVVGISLLGTACGFSAAAASSGAHGRSNSSRGPGTCSPAMLGGSGSTRSRQSRSCGTRLRSGRSDDRQ